MLVVLKKRTDPSNPPVLPEQYSLKSHYCDRYSKMPDKNNIPCFYRLTTTFSIVEI